MNMVEGKIVHLLTGKNSLQEVSVNELKTIAERQPYFSVVQLLLAKKMKQENHPEYLQQVQKTALYFPNVHWLHYQLNNEFAGEEAFSDLSSNTATPTEAVEETAPVEFEQTEVNHHIEETDHKEEKPFEVSEPITEDPVPVVQEPIAQIPSSEIDQSEPDTITETSVIDNTPEEDEHYDPDMTEADADAPVLTEENSKLASIIQQQVQEFNKEVTPESKLPIEPEPFHTVDYFASQGIKLNAKQLQEDHLGNRVRKFTDWLKQMKRVQPDPVDLGTDPELENVVQDIAANSNEAKEIVTEAMAEVLVKQGKAEKAIQLYIKLSFLNPDKSAYFAAKIQELKGI